MNASANPIPKEAWAEANKERLIQAYGMKPGQGGKLTGGTCPSCGQPELWAPASGYEVICNRIQQCGFRAETKTLYPEIAKELAQKYGQEQQQDPTERAAQYLTKRGLDQQWVDGLYKGGNLQVPAKSGHWEPTVSFGLPHAPEVTWNRLLNLTEGDKCRIFKSYAGLCWYHPRVNYWSASRVWIVEGIFDALSLIQVGEAAIATLSSTNRPTLFLEALVSEVIEDNLENRPKIELALEIRKALAGRAGADPEKAPIPKTWICAFDNDYPDPKTGKKIALEKAKTLAQDLRELGQVAKVSLLKPKTDFNDLLRQGALTLETKEAVFAEALLLGRLECATSAQEFAFYLFKKSHKSKTVFSFGNLTYSWVFKEASLPEDGPKLDRLPDSEFEDKLGQAIVQGSSLFPVAFFGLKYLYTQEDRNTGERSFFLEILHQSGRREHIELEAPQITTAPAFTNTIMAKAGVVFEGEQEQLKTLLAEWFRFPKDPVQTVPWAGFVEDQGVYVFPQVAYDKTGKPHLPNFWEFFTLSGLRIKSSHADKDFPLSHNPKAELGWIEDFLTAFGNRGLFGLCFFVGTLFCMQFRAQTGAFPFLSLVGVPGTGKSALLTFLWRLVGRSGYEGTALTDVSTAKGLFRILEHFSGLPTVFLEADEVDPKKAKGLLNPENFKPLYNGGSVRTSAMKTTGSETHSPRFRSTVVFAQNGDVEGSMAFQERLMRLYFDKSQHTQAGYEAAERLRDLPLDLSGFRHLVLSRHPEFLADMLAGFAYGKNWLKTAAKVKNTPLVNDRIAFNYAVILGAFTALKKWVPELEAQTKPFSEFVAARAVERQTETAADRPMVQGFFDSLLDVLAQKITWTKVTPHRPQQLKVFALNHALPEDQTKILKINITQVVDEFKRRGLFLPDLHQLKKELHSSTRFKFLESNKVTKSWADRSVRCWTFQVPPEEQRNLVTQLEESTPMADEQGNDNLPY